MLDCEDRAEMPMAMASYDFTGGPAPQGADATNAAIEEVSDWYLARWREHGWKPVEGIPGAMVKEVNATMVRASIDASGDGYGVVATVEGAGLC